MYMSKASVVEDISFFSFLRKRQVARDLLTCACSVTIALQLLVHAFDAAYNNNNNHVSRISVAYLTLTLGDEMFAAMEFSIIGL